jgi:three-Cys-motif partner protein
MPKVDLANYDGREQAFVKHSLLEQYLPELAYRVGKTWDAFVYVDGFAGPWKTNNPDYSDSSFGVAVAAISRCQAGLQERYGRKIAMKCILVEHDKVAFAELKRFAESETVAGFDVHALQGEFVKQIPTVDQLIKADSQNPFKFVLLDPTGWAQIPMDELKSFLHERSSEVLVNLMTRDINRFLDQPTRSDSYRRLFGRPGVLEILQNTAPENRAEQAVVEYSKSLRLLCGFKFISSAVVLEPNKESIRYFLVYATNHERGIEVFKTAEMKAARIQDYIRHQARIHKTGQPPLMFDPDPPKSKKALDLYNRFADNARNRVKTMLADSKHRGGVRYKDLFCEAMFFPLVTPNDLVEWLRELEPNVRVDFAGIPSKKKPKPSEDYRVVVLNPKALQ